ncbi:MAG: ArnT family glycosyltransferase [Candidatus Omnitrophota bacterium]
MITAEKMGPPDFYSIYGISERLYAGDLKVGIIPPLFPLLLYPLGKLFSFFLSRTDAFLLAGRILSVLAGIGVAWGTYLFLKRTVGEGAAEIGALFMVISSWYLKLLPFPITDMVYLFFIVLVFYFFLNKTSPVWIVLAIAAAVLTRYEGVLLLLCAGIFYLKQNLKQKKKILPMLTVIAGLTAGVFAYFVFFSPRIFAHLKDIILPQKSYLYLFLHPLDMANVISGSILFFMPGGWIRHLVFMPVLIVFIYGFYKLFKLDERYQRVALALLVYEVLFMIAKGYVDAGDPDREFRRIASGLWIFYLIAFIGLCFFIRYLYETLFEKSRKGLVIKTVAVLLFLIVIINIYPSSYRSSNAYAVSYARKGALAITQWLNTGTLKANPLILSFTDNTTVAYYLDKKSAARLIQFTVPMRYSPENREPYIAFFMQELKNRGVDYIVFDHYVVQRPEFLGVNDVHAMLWDEKDNPRYFWARKDLFYKGENVGCVLRPVTNAQADH